MGKKAFAVHTVHYIRDGAYTVALPGTELDLSDKDFESLTRLGAIRVDGNSAPLAAPQPAAPLSAESAPAVAAAPVEETVEQPKPAKASKPKAKKPTKAGAEKLIKEINDLVDDFMDEDKSIVG